MFVCLSAHISQKSHVQTSPNFLHMLTVTVVDPPDNSSIHYVLPVLWTTSCLSLIGQAKATPVGRILRVTHQAAAPWCKVWCLHSCVVVGAAVAVDHTSQSAFWPSIFGTFFTSAALATQGKKQKERVKATATRHTGGLLCAVLCCLIINWSVSVCLQIIKQSCFWKS